MDHSPTFTIIIPTHNRALLLSRAIQSCMAQTFSDFELIIVDDGSTDDTPTVVQSYHDARIHYVRLETAKGVSHARNTGILKAQGEYVAFLDDDDEYLPLFLAKTHQALAAMTPTASFSWCGVQRIFPNKAPQIQLWNLSEKRHQQDLLFTTQFSTSHGFTAQRTALLDVGLFDETLSSSEDIDLLLRLLDKGYTYTAAPEVLLKRYLHSGPSLSRTQNQLHFAINNQKLIDKNAAFLKQNPKVWRYYQQVLAGNYYRTQQPQAARKILFQVLKKFPFYTKAWEKLFRYEITKRFSH